MEELILIIALLALSVLGSAVCHSLLLLEFDNA
jgi:hypothetical protein